MPRRAAITKGRNTPGKRVPLNMRTTVALRKALETAANQSGRSLAQEVELRLERSLAEEKHAHGALAWAYGERAAGLALLIAAAASSTGLTAVRHTGTDEWSTDPHAFNQVADAVSEILARMKPEGEPDVPDKTGDPNWDNDPKKSALVKLMRSRQGRDIAADYIATVIGRDESGDWAEWGKELRDLLGPLAKRLKETTGVRATAKISYSAKEQKQ